MKQNEWMAQTIALACENVQAGRGGPYAAMVVKEGKVIATGTNEVASKNDPTAHAELQAIREACQKLGTTQLTDCELYASGEPCPMCMSAIFYAGIKTVYFAYSKEEAVPYGFDSVSLYRELTLPHDKRAIPFIQMEKDPRYNNPFVLWQSRPNRQE